MAHFDKNLKVKIDKASEQVTLSIKVSDNKVEVHKLPLQDFMIMVSDDFVS